MFTRLRKDKKFAQAVAKKLDTKLRPDYHSSMQKAYQLIREHEGFLSEQYGNGMYNDPKMDIRQMDLVCSLCGLLSKFYSTKMGAIKVGSKLDAAELAAYEAISLKHCRFILVAIFLQFTRLSGELRAKYKEFLFPTSMRWESLSYLAWIINSKPAGLKYDFLFSLPSGTDDTTPIEKFVQESLAIEEIMEPAVYGIISQDIPELKKLALTIKLDVDGKLKDDYAMPVFKMCSMSILIKRVGDNLSLKELLELTTRVGKKVVEDCKESSPGISGSSSDITRCEYKEPETFSHRTKFEKHATLQRIYRIGELITGKRFSLSLSSLDPSTDWRSLISVRDSIAHPEEDANYSVTQEILLNNECLDSIINEELPILASRIVKVIYERYKVIPKYHEDHEKFWEDMCSYEESSNALVANVPSGAVKKTTVVSEDNRLFLIEFLKKTPNINDEIVNKWMAIIDGLEPLPANRKDVGNLMKGFLKGNEGSPQRQEYNRFKDIIAGIRNPQTSLAEREENRKKDQDAKKQRLQEREVAFIGLDRLRMLANQFEKTKNPKMSKLQFIKASIDAVNNIIELMEQITSQQLISAVKIKGVKLLSEDQQSYLSRSLIEAFKDNMTFKMALEYNANQFFQYMERIKDYDEISSCEGLLKSYELTRSVRNYIAHGNLDTDIEHHDPDDPEIKSPRNYIVPLLSLAYCIELLPYLVKIHSRLNPFNSHLGNVFSFFRNRPKLSAAIVVAGVGVVLHKSNQCVIS